MLRAFIFLILTTAANADPGREATAHCRLAYEASSAEIAAGDITVSGPTWTMWDRPIEGDTITVPFADGDYVASGQTAAMADHVLTLALHRSKGTEPFGIKDQGVIWMVIPLIAREAGEKPRCFFVPLFP